MTRHSLRTRFAIICRAVGALVVALLATPPSLHAQAVAEVQPPPAMVDVRVPTRDGIALSTDVWLPANTGGRWPTIFMRTPYVKNEALFKRYGLARYVRAGYAVVMQDTRGRGKSEGTFDFYFPEGKDGYDSIEWIAKQAWSDGRVGMDGGSYLGTVQWLAAREKPPHLRCIIPTAASGRLFGELPYVGGAFHLGWALPWTSGMYEGASAEHLDWKRVAFERPLIALDTMTGRELPFYRAMLSHPTLDDYWRRIHFDARTFASIDIPVMIVSGWFDGDQYGALFYWDGLRASSPARDKARLIVGPWIHQQTYLGGAAKVGQIALDSSSIIDIAGERLRFFDECLRDAPRRANEPRARVFLSGDDRWRTFSEYPPREARPTPLYLASGGRANSLDGDGTLSWTPPAGAPADTFTYDPKNPVINIDLAEDHRPQERRGDVLVYTTAPLERAVTVAGPVRVELVAASDALDTDFVAKLLDVYPDGSAIHMSLQPGAIRARYRGGFDREVPLEPGKATPLSIRLYNVGHVFKAGHRIRLEITSSAFPYLNQNQNTGLPVATDTTWRVAHQTIYHDAARRSRVILPLLGAPSGAK